MTSSIPSHRVSLDDLAALNQEITALVAAGVPLDHGLALVGHDLPGRLGRITTRLSESLSQGQSLSEAVSDKQLALPDMYRTVIEAGIRSGRLAAALEGLTHTVTRIADIRRTAGLALLYPSAVLILAWTLFCTLTVMLSEEFLQMGVVPESLVALLSAWNAQVHIWGPLIPVFIVLTFAAWWYRSGRAIVSDPARPLPLLGWMALPGKIRLCGCYATFSEVFALLIDHDTPMDETLCMAGNASGQASLQRASHDAAAAVRRGESLGDATRRQTNLPPFLRLAGVIALDRQALVKAGRQAGEAYRRTAQQTADTLGVLLPAFLMVLIGGGGTLAYAVAIFWPWTAVLEQISQW